MNYKIPYDLASLSFSLSTLLLLFLAKLPDPVTSERLLLLLILIVGLTRLRYRSILLISGMLLAGFLWSTNQASTYLHTIEKYIDQKLTVQGTIKSLNVLDSQTIDEQRGYYVYFNVERINQQPIADPATISLFWQSSPHPKARETWQVSIKTKAIHSYLNQGSFDSQRFAMANRRVLSGTVDSALQLDPHHSFRQQLVDKMLPYINLFTYGDMMLASPLVNELD